MEEKSMTMAAGVRFDGGIMLCAESLYSGGDIKYSRTKIFTTRYEGGCTIFATAGHEGYAKLAVQEAQERIEAVKGRRTIKTIRSIVSTVVSSVYANHIDKRLPHELYESEIYLLIAVWSEGEGLSLFATRKTAVIRIDTYDCIGSGGSLGHYVISPSYDSKLNERRVLMLAVQALVAAKDHDPYCGGESEIIILREDGTVSPPRITQTPHSLQFAETIIREFNGDSRRLLMALTDPATMDEARPEVEYFSAKMKYTREQWLAFIRGLETYGVRDAQSPGGWKIHHPPDLPPPKEDNQES
jgi:20S proteasome alpha/beta subunit